MTEISGKVYARKATGLVRAFSAYDIFFFNVLCLSPAIVLAVGPLFGAFLFPGADMAIAVTIGMILCVAWGLTSSLMAAAMPRSGGEYTCISYILRSDLGFMMSWALTLNVLLAGAMYAPMTITYAIAGSFTTLGAVTNNPAVIALGETIATPVWAFGLGTLVIVSLAIITMLGPEVTRKILLVLFIPAMLAIIMVIGVLAISTHAGFISAFNEYMHPTTYQSVIDTAHEAGQSIPPSSLVAAFAALPLGFWMFVGFTFSRYFSGEVKDPSKSQPLATLGALMFCWVLEVLTISLYYKVVGWDFTNSVAYLTYAHPEASPFAVEPVLNWFVGILTPNIALNVFIAFGFIVGFYLLCLTVFMIPSRTLFAWSFNRVMPEKMAAVSKRTRSPWVATLVTAIGIEILMYLYVFTPIFTLVANYTLFYAIIFTTFGITAIMFPFRKKELFEASPGIVKKRIVGLPIISILGAITAIFFGFIIYFSMKSPAFSGPVGPLAYAYTILVFALGAIIYYVARWYRRREGIDIDMAFKEIPPE